MKNRHLGLAVTVPSCTCCSRRLEEDVGAALRLPPGRVKFLVPLKAEVVYDPQVVELRKVVEILKIRGCKVSVDQVKFRIPRRPLFLPQIWQAKVSRLNSELDGVISASIDFVRSVIAVDYLSDLVQPDEIRGQLLRRKPLQLEAGKPVIAPRQQAA